MTLVIIYAYFYELVFKILVLKYSFKFYYMKKICGTIARINISNI